MVEEILIDGLAFRAITLTKPNTAILLIQGQQAQLGCGYFSMAPADRTGDRFAIVTGVKTTSDLLEAQVVAVSSAAIACGVEPGMTGREALLKMERADA